MSITPQVWEVPSVPIAGAAGRFPVRHIYCVGRNYAEHAKEMGGDATKEPPFFFTKAADSVVPVVPPDVGRVRYPLATKNLHHEIELVVAIGVAGVRLAPEEALAKVWGYAVGLDMTRRDLQNEMREKKRPWDIGKSFADAAPIGPIHPVAAVGHPAHGKIWLDVNGTRRQAGDLADMIWDVPHTVAFLSQYYELLPGDLIFTGTPAGVGAVVPGDRLTGGIDTLGTLAVTVSPSPETPVTVYTVEAVERGYNNRAAVPDHSRWLAYYPESSATARAALAPKVDVRYGPGPKETLDLFLPAARAKGTFVFLHGGYWRAFDKSDFSFVAPVFVARGYAVAVVNYDLCPDVSIATIVDEATRAVAWLAREGAAHGANAKRIVVGGHSAGGHLAAMLYATDWATHGFAHEPFLGGVSLSGVHDLEPMVHFSFNADFKLDEREAARLSPVHLSPRSRAPLVLAAGAEETSEFVRQTRILWDAWPANRPAGMQGPLLVRDRNHFDVVVDWSDADSELTRATLALFEREPMTSRFHGPRRCLAAAVLLCGLAAVGPGLAADVAKVAPATAAAPRIGLALSGGGARGIAHIGVLKVLEELRVPIHCVTGTSMGSIVGGTFAAGVTPEKLQEVVVKTDWDKIFRDQPPREEIAIRRKVDDYKTLFRPEFGVKDGGLALPTGVIAGVSIEAFFRVLTAQAYDISDFTRLPIPFRAMATDIETGESVVLDHGSIAQAMRASMSVPGALAPVEIDGKLLVDGGIANNLPINEARKLCADVIIAVNISTPPLKRSEITSALSVAGQLVNFLGKQTVDEQLKSLTSRDVLIAPDLGDISAAKFDRSADAIRIGEEATRKLADSLKRYSIPPDQYAALRQTQIAEAKPLPTVGSVEFKGLERTNPEVLRALVETKPGEPLNDAKIGDDLRRIYGRDDFEGIGYTIGGGTTGPRALIIEPREKSWGPDYLRFGLGLESDFKGDNAFNVLFEYRKTWLNQLGGEWLTQAQIGQNTYIGTEFYQPVEESGRWFVLPYARVGQQTRGVFAGDDKVADYRIGTVQGGIDGGAVLDTWGQVKMGPVWTHVNARVDTGSPVLPSVKEVTAGIRAQLFVDRLDQAWFPTDGVSANAQAYAALTSLGSAQTYQKLEGAARWVKSWGLNTVQLGAWGGTDFGSDMPAYESFTLGGPLRLSGYRLNEFAGREFWFARAMYYRKIFPLPDILGSGVYAGASAETGRMSNRFDGLPSPGQLWSGSAFVGADTFVGPAFLGFGVAPAGRWSLYLLLGAP